MNTNNINANNTSPKLITTADTPSLIKRTAFTLGVLPLLLAALPASATDVYYYAPEHVTNITGRAFADAAPPLRWLNMSVFGATANAVAQTISAWQVGDFTGVTSPAPVGDYQRGINNGAYGSTAVQMKDLAMGGQLHTWSIPEGSGYSHDLANLQVKYQWQGSDNICLWTHSTSKLRFQYNLRIPGTYMEGGACGYIYTSLFLKDGHGKGFWIQPQIFDTRGVPSTEGIGWDAGTGTAYVNTFYDYNNATRYCSKDPFSYWSTSSTWNSWRTYSFTMSRAQLLNAINDLNATYGVGLNTDPVGYRVIMFTVQDEIYWPTGNGWLSMGVRDLYLSENY